MINAYTVKSVYTYTCLADYFCDTDEFYVFTQDLTSVQNLQKKHALLEADVAAHQVRPRPLHVLACYFSINLVSYIIDIIMTCHSLALFSSVIISCLQ